MAGQDDEEPKAAPKPSALLQNLAAIAARAPGNQKRYQDSRWGGSSGAASEGKSVRSWACACGWGGAAKELRPTADGLACPSCGQAGKLRSQG